MIRFKPPVYLIGLVILLLFAACGRVFTEKKPPKAEKGVLDLTDWDFEKDGPVDLSGEYEFYWKQHLEPSVFLKGAVPEKTGFIHVPGFWSSFEIDGKKLPGQGYAMYRLRILVCDREDPLALKFLDMGTAFTGYVNGKRLISVGVPGKNRETTIPRYFPQVVTFEFEKNQMELIFHVSNFHHRRAGAWGAIKLGTERDLRRIRERRIALDLFLFGSLFIIAMYHLGLFTLRKKDRSFLYFSIFCFLIAARLLTIGERYFIQLFPNTSWEHLGKLEYLSFYLSVPLFALFMRSLFPEFSRRFLQVITVTCVGLSCVVLLAHVRVFSHTLPIVQVIIIAMAIYGFYVLIVSSILKREGALIFLLGFMILSLTAINDVMHAEQVIQTGYFVALGLFVFIFSQAFLLSHRFSKALMTVETQRKEMKETLEAYKGEIIERMQVEEALGESEEKYRTILHSIEDGYYEVDLAGNLTFFNDSFCRILGYSKDELMGVNNRRFMSKETGKKVYQTFSEVYRTGKATKAFGWELIRKDGTRRFLEISVTLIRDSEGKPVGFRGIARDITEKKQAEEQAKLHQQQLMQASKMVALGTLVSGVAHEINNPNNFIMLNTPLLREAWQNAMPILESYYKENGDFLLGGMKYSEIRENIPTLFSGIIDGSKRIKQIVDDLKNFVREETSDLGQEVDINAVLESAVSLVSNMIRKSTNRFSVECGHDLPKLMGNAQRLEQVVINLIQNACQALPDTGRGISVSTSCDKERRYITVRVQDEGTGMSAEILPHITDPFYTTRYDSGGVGLGLSISSRIVEEHGGSMHLSSEPGKGTTVEIVLPVDRINSNRKGIGS